MAVKGTKKARLDPVGTPAVHSLKIQEARTRVHSGVQFLTAYFLCFLQAVSYLYFVSRLPNHHQQLDKLFYFLLVQVTLPEVSHRRRYGRVSTLFSNAAVWSAPLPSWDDFFLPEPILTIQVSFCKGGAGLQYEVGTRSYCQSVPEIHEVKVEQIF